MLFGFADLGSGLDAEGLGFVAGGDAAGGVGHGGDDGEGVAAVFGMELLFDGREEAVEVDVEEGEAVGLGGGGHERLRRYYIRLLFALLVPGYTRSDNGNSSYYAVYGLSPNSFTILPPSSCISFVHYDGTRERCTAASHRLARHG